MKNKSRTEVTNLSYKITIKDIVIRVYERQKQNRKDANTPIGKKLKKKNKSIWAVSKQLLKGHLLTSGEVQKKAPDVVVPFYGSGPFLCKSRLQQIFLNSPFTDKL